MKLSEDKNQSAFAPGSVSHQGWSKFLQMIGLAFRARQAVIGYDAILQSIRDGRACLVIAAGDAGGNGLKKLVDKCTTYDVELVHASTREALGHACGRHQVAAVSLVDRGFADTCKSLLLEINGGEAFGETSGL